MTLGEIWERLRALQKMIAPPYADRVVAASTLAEIHTEISRLIGDIERYQRENGLCP